MSSEQVDAEQSYLQPAIDWVTTTMQVRRHCPMPSYNVDDFLLHPQRKYNRSDPASWTQPEAAHVLRLHSERQLLYQPLRSRHSSRSMPQQAQPAPRLRPAALLPEHAVVYSTIQAYTVDAVPRLTLELFRAEREGYLQSVKLVRGAYMHQERARAAQLGYSDPIHRKLNCGVSFIISFTIVPHVQPLSRQRMHLTLSAVSFSSPLLTRNKPLFCLRPTMNRQLFMPRGGCSSSGCSPTVRPTIVRYVFVISTVSALLSHQTYTFRLANSWVCAII